MKAPTAARLFIEQPSLSYCDVSGVKIDEADQLQFNFNNIEDKNKQVEKNSGPDF